MPVTFQVAPHPAKPTSRTSESWRFDPSKSKFLNKLAPLPYPRQNDEREIIQSSVADADIEVLSQSCSGFVEVVCEAYNRHRHLTIRPDDVWSTILCQFSFYVNAHAEELRHTFVAHEGKQTVTVSALGSRFTVDFGHMANQMTKEMDAFLVDKTLKDWLLPQFTTTTPVDQVVYSIQMMSTLKEYFDYKMMTMCGIPSVTLDGERKDWEALLSRIPKLREFGKEPSEWVDKLLPVLTRFVECFDEPNVDFWNRVVNVQSMGSGSPTLSGWITAFSFWNDKGMKLHTSAKPWSGEYRKLELGSPKPSDDQFSGSFVLSIDGQVYEPMYGVPDSCRCSAPVELDDNGEIFKTTMLTHHVARYYTSEEGGPLDGIRMQPVWMMYIEDEAAEKPDDA